jgi:hypothetical protein
MWVRAQANKLLALYDKDADLMHRVSESVRGRERVNVCERVREGERECVYE